MWGLTRISSVMPEAIVECLFSPYRHANYKAEHAYFLAVEATVVKATLVVPAHKGAWWLFPPN
jgi:hypothetical protein